MILHAMSMLSPLLFQVFRSSFWLALLLVLWLPQQCTIWVAWTLAWWLILGVHRNENIWNLLSYFANFQHVLCLWNGKDSSFSHYIESVWKECSRISACVPNTHIEIFFAWWPCCPDLLNCVSIYYSWKGAMESSILWCGGHPVYLQTKYSIAYGSRDIWYESTYVRGNMGKKNYNCD